MQKILDEVVRHQYWKNSFKEAESMVRKAETLNDVVELKLSSRTRRQVEKRFGTDMELMVKVGRQEALSNDMHPEYIDEDPKYIQELIRSLDEAGFIRHDLYPRTWNVWGLYNAIFNYYSLAIGEVSLASLANRETFTYSKEYESMPAVSDEAFGELMTALGSLTEREQMILVLRFGLDDEKPRPTEMVGRMLGVTRERVRQIEGKALRKMRAPGCLCKLPALFGFIPPVEPEPKNCFSADGTIDIDADIRDLNLSVRAYNCLKRFAYINTVEDILNYPKEDWPKIKNLGHKALLEIQDRMHAVGYPGFSITTLS